MTFEEHLENHRNDDGTYDLSAAEADRAKELAEDPAYLDRLAAKAAKQEREAWEKRNSTTLRKLFMQAALSPALEMDVKVPLGNNTVVRYGEMNHVRIRLRKEMREKTHRDEQRAYVTEMDHLDQWAVVLDPGQTIEDAMQGDDAA